MRFIAGPSSPDLEEDLDAMAAVAAEDPEIEVLEQRRVGDALELVVLDMSQAKAEQLKERFPALIIEEDRPLEPFGSDLLAP